MICFCIGWKLRDRIHGFLSGNLWLLLFFWVQGTPKGRPFARFAMEKAKVSGKEGRRKLFSPAGPITARPGWALRQLLLCCKMERHSKKQEWLIPQDQSAAYPEIRHFKTSCFLDQCAALRSGTRAGLQQKKRVCWRRTMHNHWWTCIWAIYWKRCSSFQLHSFSWSCKRTWCFGYLWNYSRDDPSEHARAACVNLRRDLNLLLQKKGSTGAGLILAKEVAPAVPERPQDLWECPVSKVGSKFFIGHLFSKPVAKTMFFPHLAKTHGPKPPQKPAASCSSQVLGIHVPDQRGGDLCHDHPALESEPLHGRSQGSQGAVWEPNASSFERFFHVFLMNKRSVAFQTKRCKIMKRNKTLLTGWHKTSDNSNMGSIQKPWKTWSFSRFGVSGGHLCPWYCWGGHWSSKNSRLTRSRCWVS